jgi:O-antigen/teichoic acid export membrane protein
MKHIAKKLNYKSILLNPRFKQVLTLSAVNIIGIPLSIISSVIITNYLGPAAYGDIKFLFNVFTLSVVIFTFGFFHAGNRALVLNQDKKNAREYYGAELVISLILFILMSLALFFYAYFDNNIYEKGLKNILIFMIPFSWVFLLETYFEVLFQADNRIKLLADSRLYPKLLFFISVLLIHQFLSDFNGNRLRIIFLSFLITEMIVFLYIIYKVRPSFENLNQKLKDIIKHYKTYGFDVYLAIISAVGFAQLTGILISYFSENNIGVGYFALASTIATPLKFIPNVIATTHYKDFSTSKKIPRKLVLITLLISALSFIAITILVKPFINYFYGPEFLPVIFLTYLVSIGVILSGLADFLNRFLGAHGSGKALRNSAFLVATTTMLFNLVLIPRYGETGAAYTLFFSGLTYLLCMYWFYRKLTAELHR